MSTESINITDILEKIKTDFGDNTPNALSLLEEAILQYDYLNHPRIIRCILFLANGSIDSLVTHIEVAREPRDIMFWAEYVDRDSDKPKRIRDFNYPFENQSL